MRQKEKSMEILLFKPPPHSFLVEIMIPLSDLLWGGGGGGGVVALCPKYSPILMKIGKQVGFEVYCMFNVTPKNFDKN